MRAVPQSGEAMMENDAPTKHPTPARHSDNEKSRMPERHDSGRKQAPHDQPGKAPGEGELPVG
ncbi:unnamed protein product [Mycetohabitans rhizoxinica HKI 454]|uniref:Uncharacterized protein n=2 Tax=Mycetohabitans rhizoxinica TaxID=412963 RepID=E5ANJ1_MYCRK|nr:unnamed protein product [Mycetohabitans rhizoxinica HKI 454]